MLGLLDGGVLGGGDRRADYARGNFAMPSRSTIQADLRKLAFADGEGLNNAVLLKVIDICVMMGLPLDVVLSLDETGIAAGAELDEHTGKVWGLAQGPITVAELDAMDAATTKFVTGVQGVHLQTLLTDDPDGKRQVSAPIGWFRCSVRVDAEGNKITNAAVLKQNLLVTAKHVSQCVHCLTSGKPDCDAYVNGTCTAAAAASVPTVAFKVRAVTCDSGGGNKPAFRALECMRDGLPPPRPAAAGGGAGDDDAADGEESEGEEGGEGGGDGEDEAAPGGIADAGLTAFFVHALLVGMFFIGDPAHFLKALFCLSVNYYVSMGGQRFSTCVLKAIYINDPVAREALAAAGVTWDSMSPVDKQNWKFPQIFGSDEVADVLRSVGHVVAPLCGAPDEAGCNDMRQGLTESWQKAAGPFARIDSPLRLVWSFKLPVIYVALPDRVLSVSIKPSGCIKRLALVAGAYGLGELADGELLVAGHEGDVATIYDVSRSTRGKAAGTMWTVPVFRAVEGTSKQPVPLKHVTSISSAGKYRGNERVVLVDAGKHCVHFAQRVAGGKKGEFFLQVYRTVAGSGIGGGAALGDGLTARFHSPNDACYLDNDAAEGAASTERVIVSDSGNNRLCDISLVDFSVSLVAGPINCEAGMRDATGPEARFNQPMQLTYVANAKGGRAVYVADCGNNRIRAVRVATAAVDTYVGTDERGVRNGPGAMAVLDHPACVGSEPGGETLVVGNTGAHVLCMVCRVDDQMIKFFKLLSNMRVLYTRRSIPMAQREDLVESVREVVQEWKASAMAASGRSSSKGLNGNHGIGSWESLDSVERAGAAAVEFIKLARERSAKEGRTWYLNVLSLTTLDLERDFSCIKRFARSPAPRLLEFHRGSVKHLITRLARYTGSGGFVYQHAANSAYDQLFREQPADEAGAAAAAAQPLHSAAVVAAAKARLRCRGSKEYNRVARLGADPVAPALSAVQRAKVHRLIVEKNIAALKSQQTLRTRHYHAQLGALPRAAELAAGDKSFAGKPAASAAALLAPVQRASAEADGDDAEPPPPTERQLVEEYQYQLNAALNAGADMDTMLAALRADSRFAPLLQQLGDLDGLSGEAMEARMEAERMRLVEADNAEAAKLPRHEPPLPLPETYKAKPKAPPPPPLPVEVLRAKTDPELLALTGKQLASCLSQLNAPVSGNKTVQVANLRAALAKLTSGDAGRPLARPTGGGAAMDEDDPAAPTA